MKTEVTNLKKAITVLLALTSGCGMVIGTPEYWEKYNQVVLKRPVSEYYTASDKRALDAIIRAQEVRVK